MDPPNNAEFKRLKILLNEEDDGAERVIHILKYHRGRVLDRKRKCDHRPTRIQRSII